MKKPLTVLAVLCLVLAVSSGALAAKGLLTGADIRDGSVSGADIRKQSLGTDLLTASAKDSLRGADGWEGPRGSAGPAGSTGLAGSTGGAGAKGSTGLAGTNGSNGADGTDGADGWDGADGTDGSDGTNGTVTPLSATRGLTALPTGSVPTVVVDLTVPAGTYVVLAKTQLSHTGAGDSIDCWLKSGSTTLDQIAMKTLPALAAVPVPLQAVTTTASTTLLSVQCTVLVANGSANFSSLIAVPTA
jgi:hypothetical protein